MTGINLQKFEKFTVPHQEFITVRLHFDKFGSVLRVQTF